MDIVSHSISRVEEGSIPSGASDNGILALETTLSTHDDYITSLVSENQIGQSCASALVDCGSKDSTPYHENLPN